MIVYKSICHVKAFIQKILLKLLYGKKIVIGKGVTWRKRFDLVIGRDGEVIIGRNCFFNNDCSINSINRVEIGEGSIFGENVKIYDHNHRFRDRTKSIKEQGYVSDKITIGRNCWIGSNVLILKGASVGDNCVVAAGAVIDRKIGNGVLVKTERELIIEKIRGEI